MSQHQRWQWSIAGKEGQWLTGGASLSGLGFSAQPNLLSRHDGYGGSMDSDEGCKNQKSIVKF